MATTIQTMSVLSWVGECNGGSFETLEERDLSRGLLTQQYEFDPTPISTISSAFKFHLSNIPIHLSSPSNADNIHTM